MVLKSVWVVSVEVGPRSVVLGKLWAGEGTEEWKARDWWGQEVPRMGWWRCDGWSLGGGECGDGCLAARMYSVDRRARRRAMLGGAIVARKKPGNTVVRLCKRDALILRVVDSSVDICCRVCCWFIGPLSGPSTTSS